MRQISIGNAIQLGAGLGVGQLAPFPNGQERNLRIMRNMNASRRCVVNPTIRHLGEPAFECFNWLSDSKIGYPPPSEFPLSEHCRIFAELLEFPNSIRLPPQNTFSDVPWDMRAEPTRKPLYENRSDIQSKSGPTKSACPQSLTRTQLFSVQVSKELPIERNGALTWPISGPPSSTHSSSISDPFRISIRSQS